MGGVYSCLLQLCQPKTAVLLANDLNFDLLLGGLRQQSSVFQKQIGLCPEMECPVITIISVSFILLLRIVH